MATQLLYREKDNELLGLLRYTDEGLTEPCSLFGAPLATAMPLEKAEEYVHRFGLESLMDEWFFTEDGEQYSCQILEAQPNFVRYQVTDYNHVARFSQKESSKPAHELSWSRKGRM